MPDAIIDDDECNYRGEVVEGLLSSADWDLLVGVTFYSVHDSELVVDEQGDVEGNDEGHLHHYPTKRQHPRGQV